MKLRTIVCNGAFVAGLALAGLTAIAEDRDRLYGGAVYIMDNASSGNHLLVYHRAANGRLTFGESFATGGLGSGAGLGSAGALALSSNGHWVFTCNAGSDEISAIAISEEGPVLTDKVSSHGKHPISLTLHGNLLFVLNAGGLVGDRDNIAGFVFSGGKLIPLADSSYSLSADNTNPAQVGFSADGSLLIVTEKDKNIIDMFTLDNDGAIIDAKSFQSAGQTPFGFDVRGDTLFVSEAFGGATDASAVSSYRLEDNGNLAVISASTPTTETSACWAIATVDGHYAYAANTGSGTITGYQVSHDGALSRLEADGVTGVIRAGSKPADLALSNGSGFLYCKNGSSTISVFKVTPSGSLENVQTVTGIPLTAAGIAVR